MDAVTYLSNALEAYRKLDHQGQKQLLAEVVAVGQKGLAINDPKQLHQLRLCDGVQLLLPGQDASTSRGSTRSPRG